MGHKKWSEIRRTSPEIEAHAEAVRAEMAAEQERFDMTLAQLRKARQLTQAQLAAELGIGQSHVSRIEARPDVYLSTLERYIEAMGGQLEVVAVFDDGQEVRLTLGDLTERQDEHEAGMAAAIEASLQTPATA